MRAHIEMLMAGLAASLRRDARTAPPRRRPRRARGTYVPAPQGAPTLRHAHRRAPGVGGA